MITHNAGYIRFDWARYNDAWIVYRHDTNPDPFNEAMPETTIYVGVCRLRDMGMWPDAQRNTEWAKRILAEPTNRLTVMLLAVCDSEAEARNERMRTIAAMPRRPVCNERGSSTLGVSTAIICNETGMQYASGSEAARMLGVTQPMMSSHLNKRPGFERVAGLTFRRMGDAAP